MRRTGAPGEPVSGSLVSDPCCGVVRSSDRGLCFERGHFIVHVSIVAGSSRRLRLPGRPRDPLCCAPSSARAAPVLALAAARSTGALGRDRLGMTALGGSVLCVTGTRRRFDRGRLTRCASGVCSVSHGGAVGARRSGDCWIGAARQPRERRGGRRVLAMLFDRHLSGRRSATAELRLAIQCREQTILLLRWTRDVVR